MAIIVPIISLYSRNVNNFTFRVLLVLLFGILLISSFLSDISKSFFGQYYRYQGLITNFVYLEFVWLVSRFCSIREINLNKISRLIFLGGLAVSVLILIEGVLFFGLGISIYNYNGRLAGFMGNPNFAGGFLAMGFAFAEQYLYLWPVFFVAILLTGSRSALIGFLAITFLIILRLIKNKRLIVLLIILMVLGGVMFYPKREISSFDDRTVIYKKAFEAFKEKPFLGWGLENFDTAFQSVLTDKDFDFKNIRVDKAHNEILEVLVSGGVFALIVYLLIIGTTFIRLWKNREDNFVRANLYALIGFLIISQLNVLNINEYLFFYLAVGVAMSLENKPTVAIDNKFLTIRKNSGNGTIGSRN